MIVIDNLLISDEIVEKHFVCDIANCHGACCEDGDAGAPLEEGELKELEKVYPVVKEYMTPEGIEQVEKQGIYVYNEEFGNVTPTIDDAICAYGIKDSNGIIRCAIENAYNDQKINWKKPISCHLFPIKVEKCSSDEDIEYLNYEPRTDLCRAACHLGESLKVPVFEFLKEPLIRKYGEGFFFQLKATADHMSKK